MRTILVPVNTVAAKVIAVSERKATGLLFLVYMYFATLVCI